MRGNYINHNLECSDLHANYSYLLLLTGLDLYRWATSVATEACRSLSETEAGPSPMHSLIHIPSNMPVLFPVEIAHLIAL